MIRRFLQRLRAWWKARPLVDDDPWYGWADERLDEIAREKRQ